MDEVKKKEIIIALEERDYWKDIVVKQRELIDRNSLLVTTLTGKENTIQNLHSENNKLRRTIKKLEKTIKDLKEEE
jgi:cell division protein FtsB